MSFSRPGSALPDLPTAIEWLRDHWDEQREAPLRLHESHSTDGALGGMRYSRAFQSTLAWQPNQSTRASFTTGCGHPLTDGDADTCPECSGVGVKNVSADRYRYPMSTALEYLSRRPTRFADQVHAVEIIGLLAAISFRVGPVCEMLGVNEAIVLGAIRQLHNIYRAGPVARVAWTDKSEAQRAAEEAVPA